MVQGDCVRKYATQSGNNWPKARKDLMNKSTIETIVRILQADPDVSDRGVEAVTRCLRSLNVPRPEKMISSKQAREILGRGEGKPVSKPYLKSLVDSGRLHPVKLSERKTRYSEDELLSLMSIAG